MGRSIDADNIQYGHMAAMNLGEIKVCDVKRLIGNQPTADVKEVVHAEWKNNSEDYPECTNCGYMPMFDPHIDDIYYSPFCPYCGATMDLKAGANSD